MFVRDAMLKHPAGALMLRRKLILLGVDRASVDQAITETLSTVNLEETARALACDFIRKTRNLKPGETPRRLRTRVSAYLGRRGFSWDLIQSTLKAVLPGLSGPDEQEDSEAPGV
jgi:SOS response regulatory protein OraA/RecX